MAGAIPEIRWIHNGFMGRDGQVLEPRDICCGFLRGGVDGVAILPDFQPSPARTNPRR